MSSGTAWADASFTSEGQVSGPYLLPRKLSLVNSLLSAQSRTSFSSALRPVPHEIELAPGSS